MTGNKLVCGHFLMEFWRPKLRNFPQFWERSRWNDVNQAEASLKFGLGGLELINGVEQGRRVDGFGQKLVGAEDH